MVLSFVTLTVCISELNDVRSRFLDNLTRKASVGSLQSILVTTDDDEGGARGGGGRNPTIGACEISVITRRVTPPKFSGRAAFARRGKRKVFL